MQRKPDLFAESRFCRVQPFRPFRSQIHFSVIIAKVIDLRNEERNCDVERFDGVKLFVGDSLAVVQNESRLLIEVRCVPRVPHSFDELSNRSISVTVNDAIDVFVEELFEQSVDYALVVQ